MPRRTADAGGEPAARGSFSARVAAVLGALEPGDVVTYGEVALEAGFPGAARAVGTFLRDSGGAFAWWRVVRSDGRLAPGKERDQARRLRAEGVTISAAGRVVRSPSTRRVP